jgi:tRNA pseudouridine55 synthase
VAYGGAAWASIDGEPLAIGSYRAGKLHPARVFRLEGGRESPAG